MRTKLSAPMLVFILALSFVARADQDDIDNNADLQPTPEEQAKLAVLRRWPDATDVDALDMTDDADAGDADMDNDAMDKPDAADNADMGKAAADVAMDDDADNDNDKDVDDPANWTVSVLFVSAGKHFEALCDDDGKIQYVYETVELPNVPKEISTAAKDAAKDGDVVYCQKVSDESQLPIMHLWLVTVGEKNVLMDTDGKVLNVRDVPADPDDTEPPAEQDDDNKLRI